MTSAMRESAGRGAAASGSCCSPCIHKQLCSEEECPLLLLLAARCLASTEPHSDRVRKTDRAQTEGTFIKLLERPMLGGSQMEWNGFKMVRMLQ